MNAPDLHRTFGLVAFVLTVYLPNTTDAQNAPRELLTFRERSSARPAPNALPDRWRVRAVRGQQAPAHAVLDTVGGHYLRIQGQNRAAWYVHELERPIAPSTGTMMWSWRVLQSPAGADLRRAATDDAALRLFVVFRRDGLFDRTPHTLFYTSGGPEPIGYARPSFQSDDLHVVRLDGESPSTTWQCTVFDPFADYRRLWGEPARDIVAIGVLQDTEQTGAAAIADIRRIIWRPGTPNPRDETRRDASASDKRPCPPVD